MPEFLADSGHEFFGGFDLDRVLRAKRTPAAVTAPIPMPATAGMSHGSKVPGWDDRANTIWPRSDVCHAMTLTETSCVTNPGAVTRTMYEPAGTPSNSNEPSEAERV